MKTIQKSGPDGDITTSFEYDGIQRLVRVTDTEGNVTTSTYDMGDRRTEVNHPASGITSFTYDALGNVLTKQTANLAKEGKFITYDYDYQRLTGINYPDHPENDVKYYYGGRNASQNRIGRLMLREDGTGAIEYFYGKMGEVTKTRRTLIVPNQAIATYVTQWTYDSHNRLLEMIYPDEEKVTYSYNLGGLLEKVRGEKSYGYDYITKLGYDKFEQRSYLKYCNGAETFYTYDDRRRLSNLAVNSGNKTIMDNDYTFDAVSNVLSVANNASLPASGNAGGRMSHAYTYDGLYRLVSATGTYTGADSKSASYTLAMGYDNMHRIKSKSQHLTQDNVQFNGTLNVGYDLSYTYGTEAGKKFQLASVKDVNYRTEETPGDNNIENNHVYLYDKNGNLVYVNTGRMMKDGHNEVGTRERKLIWDEENRLLAVDDNGFVSNYWYDADGERTVKTSGESDQVYVNGVFSGGSTNTAKFSLYVSPYLVANQGGRYTKHIYAGSQRIVSKVGDFASYGSDPRRIEYAGANTDGLSVNYKAKYAAQQQVIKDNYKTFDVPYNGTDNDNYADGEGFCCNDGSMEAAVAQARKAQAHAVAKSFKDPDNYENLQFFYHPDHLGSSSFITNLEGEVVQHIEYVPFGEVFIEERNSVWNTPYLFNAKEFDEETGMYYYGARYYEPRLSLWMSTDPMEEKYPDYSTYIYAAQNPIAYSDPTGMEIRGVTKSDAEEFKSDVHLILGDSKFDNLRSLISLKGKKFQQIPDAALADALDGVTCSEEKAKEIIQYCKERNVEISSLGYYPNTLDPDLEKRKQYIDHIYALIDASSMLNVNMVTTFLGRVPDKNVEENLEIVKEVWPPILEYAKEKGVKIAIENCPMWFTADEWPGGQNLMTSPENWRKVFEVLPYDNLGLNYDPSHFVWQQIDYIKPIYEFKDKIFHVHYKDIKIYQDKLNDVGIMAYPLKYMSPKLCGLGDVDWGKYVSALTDIGYQGYSVIEVEDKAFEGSLDNAKKAVKLSAKYLRNFVG